MFFLFIFVNSKHFGEYPIGTIMFEHPVQIFTAEEKEMDIMMLN
jgi:hypothetical protein